MVRAGTIASEKQKIFFMDLSLAQILLFKELIELKKKQIWQEGYTLSQCPKYWNIIDRLKP